MGTFYNPKIVTRGLYLYNDYANTKCYSGSGTTVNNISGVDTNTATMIGTTAHSTDNGGCMVFDGPTNNCRINFSADDTGQDANYSFMDGVSNNFSFSFWTNMDSVAPSTGNTNAPIHLCFYGSGYRLFTTMGDGGVVDKIHVRGPIGGTWQSPVASDTIETGRWYNVTFTYHTSNGFRAYTNGSLSSTSSVTGLFSTTTTAIGVCIGAPDGWNRNIDGKIAAVSIYKDVILTDAEVLQNYNALKGRFDL